MEDENNKPKGKKIWLVLAIIGILVLGVYAFVYWLQPAYNNFILSKQQEAFTLGQEVAYKTGVMDTQRIMLTTLQDNLIKYGYAQVTFENNQTVFLAPLNTPAG